MDPQEITALLKEHINGCETQVLVDGSHVQVVVVSDQFAGLNTLKKQQLVYAGLNQAIADGRIHAVHMKTYTPSEWQALQSQ